MRFEFQVDIGFTAFIEVEAEDVDKAMDFVDKKIDYDLARAEDHLREFEWENTHREIRETPDTDENGLPTMIGKHIRVQRDY